MTTDAGAERPTRYFVRDDDIGALTEELKTFVEVFLEHRIPVSYQIIPARLTPDCAAYLLEIERSYPELVEFGQHGLHHEMQLGGRRLKREFGPERSFEQQSSDIQQGLEILKRRLGADRPIEVFTPPQHKFDANTVRAAAGAGHRVFSSACYPSLRHRAAYSLGRRLGWSSIRHHGISHHGRRRPEADIIEVSISIAVDDGRSLCCRASELPASLEAACRHARDVGLMFHHAIYSDPAAVADLRSIANALALLGQDRFFKLGDLV
jgi:hypothetical protein